MGLRTKTYLAIGLIVSLSAITLYVLSTYILNRTFSEIESSETRQNVQRALDNIKLENDELCSSTRDYASWNDTYFFAQHGNQDYITSNYVLPTFKNLDIDLAIITDDNGQLLMARAFDRQNGIEMQPPDGIETLIASGSPLVKISSPETDVNGIVMMPDGPLMVSACPIITSQYTGPPHGTLIMGRYLNADEIAYLNEITRLSVTIGPVSTSSYSSAIEPSAQGIQTAIVDERTIAGYTVLPDVFGKDSIEVQVVANRDMHQQNYQFMSTFILIMVGVILLSGLAIVFLVSRLVLFRLMGISRVVKEIPAGNDLRLRVPVGGRDELSALAAGINHVLEDMEEAQIDLQNQVLYLNTLLDNLSELFISYNEDGRIIYVNQRSRDFWGYEPNELLGRHLYEFIVPAHKQKLLQMIDLYLNQGPIAAFEVPVLNKAGDPMLVRINASRILVDGQPAGGVILADDITVRKKAEEHLIYVSSHDSLTGVFNRTHYESCLKEMSVAACSTAGIIVCDLDGLKFINDTLGHSAGDQLLVQAAEVLGYCIPEKGILARIGGDEFAMVLPGQEPSDIEKACSDIREAVAEYNQLNPQIPLVMSIGSAVQDNPSESLVDVYRRADNCMYREKLHSKRSNRASIVSALTSAMEARDFATSGHEDRLQDIVVSLGTTLGLPRERLRDLRLLARFHDIGKVGIPDRVLFKPARLTPAETAIMQQHSEIGHRIALAVPELVPIAGWILKHHEWWDGSGYPNGLKEASIPLECRILAIADAYDAMVSDRPYRKSMSHEDALAELERCAGLQFDPCLVEKFINLYRSGEKAEPYTIEKRKVSQG